MRFFQAQNVPKSTAVETSLQTPLCELQRSGTPPTGIGGSLTPLTGLEFPQPLAGLRGSLTPQVGFGDSLTPLTGLKDSCMPLTGFRGGFLESDRVHMERGREEIWI